MRFPAASFVVIALLAAAVPAMAQTNCINRERPGGTLQANNAGLPNEVMVITKPDLLCEGNRRLVADLATVSRASGRTELIGNVEVQDPEQKLTAERATFLSRTKHLTANGRVVLTDRSGSTIRGDLVEYDQKTPERPARIEAVGTSSSARAIMVDTTGAKRDSTIVDASQILIVGEDVFRANNNAVMTRDSMRATGAAIFYSKSVGSLDVTGNARVTLPGQVAMGDSITATLGADDQIKSVFTRHGASIRNSDMAVIAPAIRLFFDSSTVSRMVALPWKAAQNAMPSARPHVDATDFRMDADSIDVLAPKGQLTSAAAIGKAYGERITPDSLKARLPEVETTTMGMIANDWMRGDTLRAFFVPNPNAARDTAAADQMLDRILAIGQPAQSIYRITNEEKPEAKLSISYLNAKRIEVSFAKGVAQVVSAEGDVKGVYLQPGKAASKAGSEAGRGSTPGGRPGGPPERR
jgi:lipopolysaccharide export system protein LptA